MVKKIVKSISVNPIFYSEVEKLANDNRVAVSIIVEEALKEAVFGEKSVLLANITKKAK